MGETTDRKATLVQVKTYFGYTSAAKFAADWRALTDADQEQIKGGIGNGTFTY